MKRSPYRVHILAICLLLMLSAVEGCAQWGGSQNNPPPNPVGQSAPPASSSPGSAPPPSTYSGPRPQFFDFPDIPIPAELDLISKDSYVFQAGQFKAGVLSLKGRVDLNSVINFFQMAMPRENWKPKGGFRYRRSVLIYEKADKTCIIHLHENMLYCFVDIYVAPSGGQI